MKTNALKSYQSRLTWLGNHEVAQRKRIVDGAFEQSEKIGWLLMRDEWTYSEINYPYAPIIAKAKSAQNLDEIRRWFMTKDEFRAWQALPDSVTCWRGGEEYICHVGMSWSYDRGVAERFLKIAYGDRRALLRIGSLGRGVLVKATIPKADIFAVKLDRDEREIIKFPGPVVHSVETPA